MLIKFSCNTYRRELRSSKSRKDAIFLTKIKSVSHAQQQQQQKENNKVEKERSGSTTSYTVSFN